MSGGGGPPSHSLRLNFWWKSCSSVLLCSLVFSNFRRDPSLCGKLASFPPILAADAESSDVLAANRPPSLLPVLLRESAATLMSPAEFDSLLTEEGEGDNFSADFRSSPPLRRFSCELGGRC